MNDKVDKSDFHVILIASAAALLISAGMMTFFISTFTVKNEIGVCEKYGWQLEGSGPYQHRHCYDPNTRLMYLPKEIKP